MIIYEFITQIIILLARFRYWYLKKFGGIYAFTIRKDRDEANLIRQHNLDHEGFYLSCCDCENTEEFNTDDFMQAIVDAKAMNWKFRKERGEWEHYCFECAKEM